MDEKTRQHAVHHAEYGVFPHAYESISHPTHYGGEKNRHEHVKCMEAVLKELPVDPFVGGLVYNCTKYLWRLGRKGQDVEEMGQLLLQDARKAQWYLNRLVEYLEKR